MIDEQPAPANSSNEGRARKGPFLMVESNDTRGAFMMKEAAQKHTRCPAADPAP